MAAATSIPVWRAAERKLRLAPSLPDLLFALMLIALFGRPYGWQALLADGDTGWHIRTGEYILAHGAVPARDLFSFSRAGQPWYAWEWMADVILARLHQWWGLPGVAVFAGVLVCLTAALLFSWLLDRGAGLWVALLTTMAVASAASVHYLARPHLFSLLLLVIGLWVLDVDRRAPTPWVWTLVPMTACWTNLHGGFVAWVAILWLLAAVSGRRYAILAALASLATLANPYGWQLHRHIWSYLRSPWIAEHVEEFQSPSIRSESTLIFAALLLVSIALAARNGPRSQWFDSALVFVWGFAALRSARYIPLLAVVSAPVVASRCAAWWQCAAERAGRLSAVRVLWESGLSLAARPRLTPWMAVLGALAVAAVSPSAALGDFPAERFPVVALAANRALLTASPAPRLLTSDQWADYVIYRQYPGARVFFDGRSDFYGERVGDDYRTLLTGSRGYDAVMARYGFTLALLPVEWPLGELLERDPGWSVVYCDRQAVLLARKGGGQ